MRLLPPEPNVGDRVTAELIRELIRCIRERQLLKGPNYSLQTTPNGTVLKIEPGEKSSAVAEVLPWTFSCTIGEGEVEGEEERTGGWTNCRLQIGMDIDWHSPDVGNSNVHVIGGTDLCDDGAHYLEVVLANGTEGREVDTAEIKVASPGQVPASNYIDGRIRIQLGVVQDGVIGHTPHFNPVIYKYV